MSAKDTFDRVGGGKVGGGRIRLAVAAGLGLAMAACGSGCSSHAANGAVFGAIVGAWAGAVLDDSIHYSNHRYSYTHHYGWTHHGNHRTWH